MDFCGLAAYFHHGSGNIALFVSFNSKQRRYEEIFDGNCNFSRSIVFMGSFISGSFEYGKGYLTDSKEYTYVWEQIIGIIETIETGYVLRAFHRTILCASDKKISSKKSLYLFTLIWTAISVIALPFSYAIFRRYTMLCTITSIPLVSELFKNDRADKYRRTLFYFSFIIFALSGVRGDLCGYKFFVLG